MPPKYGRQDMDHSPMIVFYEVTRACDLLCRHCRASAQPMCDPNELTNPQARQLIRQLAEFDRSPLLVLTGGDPLKRLDIFNLVETAIDAGLEVAMTPSATPLVTIDAIRRLKSAGLHRLAVSLDGADAETHDGFRRVNGSFQRTLEIIADARDIGLPVQINTTVARHNFHQVDAIADLLTDMGIVLWSVFFLVPTGRGQADQRLGADEIEVVFEKLYRQSKRQPYPIKTTEAPHYRRFLLQQARKARQAGAQAPPFAAQGPGSAPSSAESPAQPPPYVSVGTNDGKGVMFVSHTGEIYPSGFLPICCGRFPQDSVVDVYRHSPLFVTLRDADRLGGKCGVCEYRNICGGSRARSYALLHDPLAAEPDCAYVPPSYENDREICMSPAAMMRK